MKVSEIILTEEKLMSLKKIEEKTRYTFQLDIIQKKKKSF